MSYVPIYTYGMFQNGRLKIPIEHEVHNALAWVFSLLKVYGIEDTRDKKAITDAYNKFMESDAEKSLKIAAACSMSPILILNEDREEVNNALTDVEYRQRPEGARLPTNPTMYAITEMIRTHSNSHIVIFGHDDDSPEDYLYTTAVNMKKLQAQLKRKREPLDRPRKEVLEGMLEDESCDIRRWHDLATLKKKIPRPVTLPKWKDGAYV